jgi:uncharacterized membrane protein
VTTFTYAVLVPREVAPDDVPELSVTVAIVLAILSVLVFVYYVSEIAQSLRLANIVDRAGTAARDEIAAMPSDGEPGAEQRELGWSAIEGAEARTVVRWTDEPGVVTTLDLEGMRALAEELEAILELRMAVGDFLTTGAPTVAVYGTDRELGPERGAGLMATANERTFSQDPAVGLRQLTDIAARALSRDKRSDDRCAGARSAPRRALAPR